MKYALFVFGALSGLSLAEIQWIDLEQAEDLACEPMLSERLAERYPGKNIQCRDKLTGGGYSCHVTNEGKAKSQLKLPGISLDNLSEREGGLQYCLGVDMKFIQPEIMCYFKNRPHTLEDPRKSEVCAELLAKPTNDKLADDRIVFPDN